MTTIVLWDIDGTLVRSNGGRVSVSAFIRALGHAAGLADDAVKLPYPKDSGGKTDEQIALEMLVASSITADLAPQMLPRFREVYLAELERDREKLIGDLRVLPGVPEALASLQQLGVTQSLLTGNLEPIARLKLACAGLSDYVDFDLGAYGSDDRDRTCLVPVTRQRLRQRLGTDVPAEDIVIVGDTPRDIACARAGGTRIVAVATGNYSRSDLEAHNPDVLLDDLQDTDQVVAALLGTPARLK
jgi:phosphoglycolate phosphatase-like HAD superfamily hydrolase